jgi:hypothetical protein
MADPETAESCQVTLLVPHPSRTAVLVADDSASVEAGTPARHPRLPTVRMTSAEPSLTEILASVDVVDTATTAVLRQVKTTPTKAGYGVPTEPAEVSLMLEFDAGGAAPPTGWMWQDPDAHALAELEPETARCAVASWVRERDEGWSPQRPAWSQPGWLARASAWIVEQMAEDGRPAIGAPRQHHLWGLSVVLRTPSTEGDVFFKCSPEAFRQEAAITQRLAELMPGLVPDVIAVERSHGWMLMRDLAATELGDQDQTLWHEGVVAHAAIQQLWLGRTDQLADLGLPVRTLPDLATHVEQMTGDTALLERMPPELCDRFLAAAPTLVQSCLRLDEIGPGPALVHGDFHPWNIVHGPLGARVFDWTDAAVSHPFVDLATYVYRTRDVSVRRRLVDAYLAAWSTRMSEESLREAGALGLVVGALYQVQTYRDLLPTLMAKGADDGLDRADVNWIDRSLTRHQQGLDSPI